MSKLRHYAIAALLAATAMLALYGCGAEPTATPAPATDTPAPPTAAANDTPAVAEPTVTTAEASGNTGNVGGVGGASMGNLTGPVADLLGKTQQAMKDIKSYHFAMDIAQADNKASIKGEGDYMAPDNVRMQLGGMMGMTETVETILIGDDIYTKQPGTDQYMALPGVGAGLGGMSALNDLDSTMAFSQYADDGKVIGDETIDGVETTHITFTYDADKAMQAAGQAAGGAVGSAMTSATPTGSKAKADMWIAKSNNYPVKIVYVSKAPSADPMATPGSTIESTVTIIYSKINEPVSPPIEKPTNILELPGMMGGTPGLPGGLPTDMSTPVVPNMQELLGTPVP